MLWGDTHLNDSFGLEHEKALLFNVSSDFGKDLFILEIRLGEAHLQVLALDCVIRDSGNVVLNSKDTILLLQNALGVHNLLWIIFRFF